MLRHVRMMHVRKSGGYAYDTTISGVSPPEKLLVDAGFVRKASLFPKERVEEKIRRDDICLKSQSRKAFAENPNACPGVGAAVIGSAAGEGPAGTISAAQTE